MNTSISGCGTLETYVLNGHQASFTIQEDLKGRMYRSNKTGTSGMGTCQGGVGCVFVPSIKGLLQKHHL